MDVSADEPVVYVDDLSPDSNQCNLNVANKTARFGGFEGIPENILINFIIWLIVVGTFTLLRRKAWNYGRLALLREHTDGEAQQFHEKARDRDKTQCSPDSASVTSQDSIIQRDQGYFTWIPTTFMITEEQVVKRRGVDAAQYLSFQRHILAYTSIVCAICLIIALPINFQGDLEGGDADFGHTTMANLRPESPMMWTHVTLAFFFLPLGIFFMRRFSCRLRREATSSAHTLMISRVPRAACFKENMMKHFQEAYPEMEIKSVEFAYSVQHLIAIDKAREQARAARLYCEKYLEVKKKRLEVRPYRCGNVCRCCSVCGCPAVDAIEFYTEEEANLCEEVERLRLRSLQRPTGVAFLTLAHTEDMRRVLQDHIRGIKCISSAPTTSVTPVLKPYNWFMRRAPLPNDIYWEHLSVTNRMWWPKAILINSVLFVVLFLFTTPALVLNNLELVLSGAFHKIYNLSPLIEEFLPTVMLLAVASSMPVIVAYSDRLMSHWTRSAENHSIMFKSFTFLMFMVIILPSFGLTSARGLAEWLFTSNNGTDDFRWECIFLPDNGALFVNYVITSALLGTSLELLRAPQLLFLVIGLCLARSKAETASVRRGIMIDFPFGTQYSWMLLNFAMTIIYSVSCPLITPFGVLYLALKHLVDKYNIYFVYGTSYINIRIHTTAINFVLISIACLQLSLLFFSLVRQGIRHGRTIYSIVLLGITGIVFLTQNIFHWISAPGQFGLGGGTDEDIDEDRTDTSSGESGETTAIYVPSVLRDVPCGLELDPLPPSPHRDYGTVSQATATEQRGEEETSFSEGSDDSSLKQDSTLQQGVTTEGEMNGPSNTPDSNRVPLASGETSASPESFC
ncbi:hypothetical protein Pcinc_014521 [Petrolisthes cinctipes]|uniref:4Fe-4S ferredoxin-type domain-containing protein n=1 Tax=Petrolisthes cinctipes TaxID=88211 RepID=A0AAE1FWC3_PETCI|nr:hypothetical protein Pcinc_014521 [Petrolisthes cinctipes]